MSKSKWNALPPDIQKIVLEVASETRDKQGALWDQMDIEARNLFLSKGGQIIELTDTEAARWIKSVEPVTGEYKKTMVSKGYKESEIEEWIRFIKEKIGYWHKEQKRRGIPSPF